MTRILLIPVAGTIAALAIIAFARQEREPTGVTTHPELMPFDLPDALDHGGPDDGEAPVDEEPLDEEPGAADEAGRTPAPEADEFDLQLEADGTLAGEQVRAEVRVSYASIDDLLERIGNARHTLVITNGTGVDRATLDAAEALLRDRFTVRKVYRAPEAPPGEGR